MTAIVRTLGLLPILLLGNTLAQETAAPAGPATAAEGKLLKDLRPLTEAASTPLTFGTIADKILPSVVTIQSLERIPSGSGFIITRDGFILTTSSVAGSSEAVEVLIKDGDDVRNHTARVISSDAEVGAALLKIEGVDFPRATLGDSSLLKPRHAVIAAGAAIQPHRSAVRGVVQRNEPDAIETDMPVAALDSGGPLVDGLGRVIGISVASLAETDVAHGLAIPMNLALARLEKFILADPAKQPRAFLGIQIEDSATIAADPANPASSRQVKVTLVGGGSPAELAGIVAGDIITAVDGQPISGTANLRSLMSVKNPGDEVAIDVQRGGQVHKFKALLTEVPVEATTAPATPMPGIQTPGGPPPGVPAPQVPAPAAAMPAASADLLPGLTIGNLTPDLRQQHSIRPDINGVVVTQVAANSHAAAMDIRQGDVITQVSRKPVSTVEEARALATEAGQTVVIKVNRQGTAMLFMVGR